MGSEMCIRDRNEGYVVVVQMTGEMDATDALSDYLRKRTELMY